MTLGDAQAGRGTPALKTALDALQRAGSRTQVRETVRTCLRDTAGADDAVLLATERCCPPPHRCAEALEAAAVTVIGRNSPFGRLIAEGRPVQMESSDPRTAGLTLPPEMRAAHLLPCSGAGSTRAVLALWRGAAPEPDPASGAVAGITGMALERLDALRRERQSRYELQNRVCNIVATIRAVSNRSAERAESLDDFILHFEGRLDAMSRQHVLFARIGADRFDLEDLVRSELLAEGIQEGADVRMKGMPITIARTEAEPLGLALHELAVNSVKFGPFSGRSGSLSVRWWSETSAGGVLSKIEWCEACELPAPLGPYRVGFGRHILERALPYELGATIELVIGPHDMRCRIAIPADGKRQTAPQRPGA